MNRLYLKGNYVVGFKDGASPEGFTRFFARQSCFFSKSLEGDYTVQMLNGDRLVILAAELAAGDWLDAETGGDPYTESTLVDFLTTNTNEGSSSRIIWGDIQGNIDDQSDLKTELDSKISDQYAERWDVFNSPVSSTWNVVRLSGNPANRIVMISIDPNGNNVTVGVREVDSSLVRTNRVDNDSTASFIARTNASGEIEVFTTSTGASFQVQAYLN